MNKIDRLLESGNWRGPVSDERISALELILDVNLPDDYRYFIQKYGCGSMNGIEIAGIDRLLTSDGNVLTRTILQLRDYRHFPKDYLFFSDSGDGGQLVFDRTTWHVLEVYARPPKDLQQQKIADSFTAFLELKLA